MPLKVLSAHFLPCLYTQFSLFIIYLFYRFSNPKPSELNIQPLLTCQFCINVVDSDQWVQIEPSTYTEEGISKFGVSTVPGRYECIRTRMRWVWLDYCNALLGGCSARLINKLQMVQNAAARVLTRTRKYDHISLVMSTLHWLPIKHRIDFKILLITYKALNGLPPQYLSELVSHYSPPRPLRSQNSGHLIIPRISKSTAGGRSFFYLAPKLWNNLTNTFREADTLCQFKSRLKTHLFNLAYT